MVLHRIWLSSGGVQLRVEVVNPEEKGPSVSHGLLVSTGKFKTLNWIAWREAFLEERPELLPVWLLLDCVECYLSLGVVHFFVAVVNPEQKVRSRSDRCWLVVGRSELGAGRIRNTLNWMDSARSLLKVASMLTHF
jgi:hypothetical protein